MTKWKWTFEQQGRMRPSGINLAEPNFTRESRNIVRLFKREFNQNVIDARCDDANQPDQKKSAHIRVRILNRTNGLDTSLLSQIFKPLEDHLISAGHAADQRDWKSPHVLVIEEFQTVGLTGVVDNSRAEGESERWANFWFGEGKRTKSGTNLGRQGQGKITYHLISGARAVLALTRRQDDQTDYLFGKAIVQKTHQVGANHYTHHGYWPQVGMEDQPMPETDPVAVSKIKAGFGLVRKNESGTSWIIPFIPDNFTAEALLREFVGDFFFSILNGDITADIDGTIVNSGSLMSIVAALKIEEPSQKFFTFLEDCITSPAAAFYTAGDGWDKGERIPEDSFSEADLSRMREDFRLGNLVSVKLPITVQMKNGSDLRTSINVYVQSGDDITKVEEIYVRSGLQIADEKWLKDQTHKAFGMVVAADRAIAEFLGYCEVASHLQWNSREKEAIERYRRVPETLSCVRKSLPKLFRFLAGTNEALVEDALEDILSLPRPAAEKKKGPRKTKKPKKTKKKPKAPDLFAYSETPGQWKLSPGPDAAKASYPRQVTFRFAYDRVDGTGNPWSKWHPYDFDLSAGPFQPKDVKGLKILSRDGQELGLKILKPNFKMTIGGFSKEQPLLIQPLE